MRRLAWLAVALVLSLLFMPQPRPVPVVSAQHHHHAGGHHGHALADLGAGHRPADKLPKGCGDHGGCPFCTAHPGYSPPPPQMAALPVPEGFPVAAGPVAAAPPVGPPQFLTSLRPRAPPFAPV